MGDLIDREQAIKEICREVSEQESNAIQGEDLDVGVIVGLKMAVRITKEQPSAEKTGKWLDMGKFTDIDGSYHEVWRCDCCGYISHDDSNYCPNCGAKMEEEEGDENDL